MIKKFKPGKKKCKQCGNSFDKNINQPFQVCCSIPCAIDYSKKKINKIDKRNSIEQKKKWNEEKKRLSESLKSPAQLKNDLQVLFNNYIRARDEGKPCISCGCDMTNRKGDASHYYAVSIAPSLRFDEDNVHLSCVPCNQYKSGNLIEYGLRLPARIGKERFDALLDKKQLTLNLNTTDIKEKIEYYKKLLKNLR